MWLRSIFTTGPFWWRLTVAAIFGGIAIVEGAITARWTLVILGLGVLAFPFAFRRWFDPARDR